MAFTKILPAGISTTGLVTVDSLSVGDVTLTGDTDNLIINTDTVTVRPTLDLNFARDKRLDSKITFTRDSVGTYVDANGLIQTAVNNIPRFDHDPVTGESLGLLIEEQRTNLCINSTSSSNWGTPFQLTKDASKTITAPSGDIDAYEWTETTADTTHLNNGPSVSISSGSSYSISAFFKRTAGTLDRGYLLQWYKSGGGQTVRVSYVPSTDTTYISNSNGASAPTNVSVVTYPNGWYKISFTAALAETSAAAIVGVTDSSGLTSFTGDTSMKHSFWGLQYELGSFATSYIPTSGSTVTRNKDIAVIKGTNFTDFYNQTEGTIFFNYKNLSTDTSTIRGVWGLENSVGPVSGIRSPQSGSLRIRLLYNSNFSPSSSNLFLIDTNYKKGVVAYNQTENRLMMDGTSDFVSATHTNDDTIVALSIGSRTINGDSPLGGHIKYFKYYNKRLSNAQLQNLTK